MASKERSSATARPACVRSVAVPARMAAVFFDKSSEVTRFVHIFSVNKPIVVDRDIPHKHRHTTGQCFKDNDPLCLLMAHKAKQIATTISIAQRLLINVSGEVQIFRRASDGFTHSTWKKRWRCMSEPDELYIRKHPCQRDKGKNAFAYDLMADRNHYFFLWADAVSRTKSCAVLLAR